MQRLHPRPDAPARRRDAGAGVALIGAGAFARATLIPALKDAGARLVAVTSEGGLTAADVAARFGFERAAASVDEILADDSIRAVVIATPHASHAASAAAALRAGKAVFVEKPLALSREDLREVEESAAPDSVLDGRFQPPLRTTCRATRRTSSAGCDDLTIVDQGQRRPASPRPLVARSGDRRWPSAW